MTIVEFSFFDEGEWGMAEQEIDELTADWSEEKRRAFFTGCIVSEHGTPIKYDNWYDPEEISDWVVEDPIDWSEGDADYYANYTEEF